MYTRTLFNKIFELKKKIMLPPFTPVTRDSMRSKEHKL